MWSTLKGLYQVADLFYNGTRTETCFDINTNAGISSSDMRAWEYQTCSELIMPIGSYGYPSDMFYSDPWDEQVFRKNCLKNFGVEPQLSLIHI